MSKGPFNARIEGIHTEKEKQVLKVELLDNAPVSSWARISGSSGLEDVVLPANALKGKLVVGDVITYYRAERPGQSNALDKDKQVVLLFKRDETGTKLPKDGNNLLWLARGKMLAELNTVPRVVEILSGLSSYYGKRQDVLGKTVNILSLSQDPEAIDALFSIQKETLNALLNQDGADVAVQVADSLLSLLLSGADLEHPSRRDLRQFLSLAVLHGEKQSEIDSFIEGYVQQ